MASTIAHSVRYRSIRYTRPSIQIEYIHERYSQNVLLRAKAYTDRGWIYFEMVSAVLVKLKIVVYAFLFDLDAKVQNFQEMSVENSYNTLQIVSIMYSRCMRQSYT